MSSNLKKFTACIAFDTSTYCDFEIEAESQEEADLIVANMVAAEEVPDNCSYSGNCLAPIWGSFRVVDEPEEVKT